MTTKVAVDETERLKGVLELQELNRLFGADDLLSAIRASTALLLVAGPEHQTGDSRPTRLKAAIEEIAANARQEALTIPRNTKGRPRRCEMLAAAGELLGLTDQAALEQKYGIELEDAALREDVFALNNRTKTGLKKRAVVWVRLTHVKTTERRMWEWYNVLLEELRQHFDSGTNQEAEQQEFLRRFRAWRQMVKRNLVREAARYSALRRRTQFWRLFWVAVVAVFCLAFNIVMWLYYVVAAVLLTVENLAPQIL